MYKVPIKVLKDNKDLLESYLILIEIGCKNNKTAEVLKKRIKKQIKLLKDNYLIDG